MSRKYTIMALFAGIALFFSFSANPPNGRTGGPGEGLCSDCHSLNGGTQDGSISVTGLPASITPNNAYVLTMTSSNPNGVATLAGFQLTILNSNNQQAGTITAPSAGSTVQSASGRQYWEHNPAQTYPGSNMVTWTATWTAPNMPPNTTVTIYAAGNIANGNGSSSGDRIVTTTASGMLMGGGSNLLVTITSSSDVLCEGGNNGSATATATGGTTPYTYNWSNGATGPTVNNFAAGSYVVTVTDNASATATASVVIDEPSELFLNTPSITHLTCNGSNNGSITVSASGGVSPYSFNWSNGSSGTTISNLAAGNYTVTVTDDNSCTKTATYTVTQPAAINITENIDHESCAGQDDGAIGITVTGGASPFFAEWSNGSIGMSIADLEPGVYSVTVTDNNDCTKSETYTINPGGTVVVNLVQITHVTCFGGNNGSITLSSSGGVLPYTYNWSNGMTGSTISGLSAGSYVVSVSDMNGCVVIEGYTIDQPDQILIAINQTSQNLCFGDATADLQATTTGGVIPYSSMWSNGVAGMSNQNVAAGTYTITVTDGVGCSATSSATVTQPALLSVNVATTNETSSGANDGTAAANVSGGTGPFAYSWSNGATTQSISNLSPGTYCVSITDQNGCSVSGCGQVNEFGCSISVTLGNDVTICEGNNTTLVPVVNGASGNVTYLWTGGTTGNTLVVADGGEYCVSVTDQTNCQTVDCIIITEDSIPLFDCPVQNETIPGANDGAIICSGNMFVSYQWSTGAATADITGLGPGEYCVTVTNINGCIAVHCYNVQPGNCQLGISAVITSNVCAGGSQGSVVLEVSGATEPVTYAWSNGGTNSSIINMVAGEYHVTISDAAGCIEEQTYTITEPPPILITVDSIENVQDFPSGLIHVSVSGGTPSYSFLWLDPEGAIYTTEDLDELFIAGYYTLTVTDDAGCEITVDSIFVDIDLATNSLPIFSTVKVYPNPAIDELFIKLENVIEEVLITGVDGRLYKRIIDPASNKIHIGELESGWYFLRITDGENWYIARVVK